MSVFTEWTTLNRLETCGFRVEKVDYTKTLSDKEISKYCLNKGEIIPVVYKPNQMENR